LITTVSTRFVTKKKKPHHHTAAKRMQTFAGVALDDVGLVREVRDVCDSILYKLVKRLDRELNLGRALQKVAQQPQNMTGN
jgi:hypothetical protein